MESSTWDLVIMDLSKAFDKVCHNKLLFKLEQYNVNTETLRWISSILKGREQSVLVDGKISPSVPVTSGVPQALSWDQFFFLHVSTFHYRPMLHILPFTFMQMTQWLHLIQAKFYFNFIQHSFITSTHSFNYQLWIKHHHRTPQLTPLPT